MRDRPDLSDGSVRKTLKAIYRWRSRSRREPLQYWNPIALGRHLGYEKTSKTAWWVARYRNNKGKYHQRRIACADDLREADGIDVLSCAQAIERANKWFQSPKISKTIGNYWMSELRQQLLYCPVGEVYTIAHALTDYFEWKRMAVKRSYSEKLAGLINKYVLPQIGALAVDEFTSEHFRKLVQDVLETPPKTWNQRPLPRISINKMDQESLRKRKFTANAMIGGLGESLEMAWQSGKTQNDRSWRVLRYLRTTDRPRNLFLSRPECRALLQHCASDLEELCLAALY